MNNMQAETWSFGDLFDRINTLLGLPTFRELEASSNRDRDNCVHECSKTNQYYQTECLAKCGITPASITYNFPASQDPPDGDVSQLQHRNTNNKIYYNDEHISRHVPSVNATVMSGSERLNKILENYHNNNNQPELNSITPIDIKYFYWFAFLALVPILVLFYCCYKQFTKPQTSTYTQRNRITRSSHRRCAAAPIVQLPSEIQRTVSLPAYEDCIKPLPVMDMLQSEIVEEKTQADSSSKCTLPTSIPHHTSVLVPAAPLVRVRLGQQHHVSNSSPCTSTCNSPPPPSYRTVTYVTDSKQL